MVSRFNWARWRCTCTSLFLHQRVLLLSGTCCRVARLGARYRSSSREEGLCSVGPLLFTLVPVAAAAVSGGVAAVRSSGERLTSALQHFAAGSSSPRPPSSCSPTSCGSRRSSRSAAFAAGIVVMFGFRAVSERAEHAREVRGKQGLPVGLLRRHRRRLLHRRRQPGRRLRRGQHPGGSAHRGRPRSGSTRTTSEDRSPTPKGGLRGPRTPGRPAPRALARAP